MLVHSCAYYDLNESMISDDEWQKRANELAELITKYPELNKDIDRFDPYFQDWDGSSGYHLPTRDPWVLSKTYFLLDICNEQQLLPV